MTPDQEIQRFIKTDERDVLHAAWPSDNFFARAHAADTQLRSALIEEVRRRTKDQDPFADWVVHEAAHVFHNWKRDRAGLPSTRTKEFLLEIAFSKREVFAYACEAYARILEQATSPASRKQLHAAYAEKHVPTCEGLDQAELVSILAEAVDARNGWKRILRHCSPMS